MVLLEEILAETNTKWADLDAIGVGVGPGNFTGIRVGVSAARGLALALEIPAVGVTGCEARARLLPPPAAAPATLNTPLTAAIPAPRDHVYLCDGAAVPQLMPLADAMEKSGPVWAPASPDGIAAAIAAHAATCYRNAPPAPAPLYARAADAAPSRDSPPTLLET
jgi:tRNA threonylcarbamoyl adenosine modification protein YeaZ